MSEEEGTSPRGSRAGASSRIFSGSAQVSSERLYRYSFVEERGPFLGDIVKFVVGNPVTNYYEARVKRADGRADLTGFALKHDIEKPAPSRNEKLNADSTDENQHLEAGFSIDSSRRRLRRRRSP